MKKRLVWIDSARGLAFLMVIYAHIEFTNEILMAYFSPVFLTMFFFVSGYLFNEKRGFVDSFKQRCQTIIVPFLVFGLLNILLGHFVSFNEHLPLIKELAYFFLQIRGKYDLLWFLACIFVASISFYFVIKFIKVRFLIPFLFTLLLISKSINLPPVPWHLQLIIPAMFYMACGFVFRKYEPKFSFIDSTKFAVVVSVVYILEVTVYLQVDGELLSFIPVGYVAPGVIVSITGLLACVSLSRSVLIYNSFIVFIGANSLLYFCLHGKAISIVQNLYHFIFSYFDVSFNALNAFITGVFSVFITAVICIIPVSMVNRFFPWSVGKVRPFMNK